MAVKTDEKRKNSGFSWALLLPVLLPVILLTFLLIKKQEQRVSNLASLALLEPKLPEDKAYSELFPILEMSVRPNQTERAGILYSEEERRCWRAENQEMVDALMVWYETRGNRLLDPLEGQGSHLRTEPAHLGLDENDPVFLT